MTAQYVQPQYLHRKLTIDRNTILHNWQQEELERAKNIGNNLAFFRSYRRTNKRCMSDKPNETHAKSEPLEKVGTHIWRKRRDLQRGRFLLFTGS